MTIIAFNRYWIIRWPWALVSLMAASILMGLSLWQLSRATEKTQTLARIADWQHQGAVGTAQLALLDGSEIDSNKIDGLQLDFRARWLSPMVWLLDNQLVDGRIGYDVIIAVEEIAAVEATSALGSTLALEAATAVETANVEKIVNANSLGADISDKKYSAVLVNLGWVAAPSGRDLLPPVVIPSELQVQGVFRTRTTGLLLGTNIEDMGVWPMRIQQMDVAALAPYVQQPLHAGVIYQQQQSPFKLHYNPVILPAERHRAYALQWALLAVAAIVIALAAGSRKELVDDQS